MFIGIEVRIKKALNDVKAWQRIPTSIDGIFLVNPYLKKEYFTIMT